MTELKKTELKKINLRLLGFIIAALLSIITIIAFWVYRDDLFQSIYDPAKPFQTTNPPPAPDYRINESWIYRPDAKIDPIHFKGGDVFVITPSLFLGRKGWNADINNEKFRQKMENIALPNYALPFKNAGRVYAPYYRQAALYTFLTNRDDAVLAKILAYEDIKRAFSQFIQENPPERPIILVGFGQGGLHVQKLLIDFFDGEKNKDLRQKLAAAYIVDFPLPIQLMQTQMPDIKPCASKQDVNCVIAFGAFTPDEKKRAKIFMQKAMVWDNNNWLKAVEGKKTLCVNPLLWSMDTDYAPARLHKGGVAAEGLGDDIEPATFPSQTGAQCQNGILLIEQPKTKSLRRPSRFGGKFRTMPSNLFYEDLKLDAKRRVDNLLAKDVLPKRAPLLDMETIEVKDSPITLPLKPIKRD